MALIPNLTAGGGRTSKVVPSLYTRKASKSATQKSSSTAARQAVKNAVKNVATNKVSAPSTAPKKNVVNKNTASGAPVAGVNGAALGVRPQTTVDTTPKQNGSSGASKGTSNVTTVAPAATQTNRYQELLDYFKKNNETARQSAINAIIARINAQKGAYNTQMDELGDQYQALRNQSEVERYKTRNALREAQANRGQLDSGYGRQEQLLMDTAYGNAINSINLQEQSARNEIKNAIQQLEAEGEADKTEVNNNYASALQQYIAQLQKDSQ